MSFPRRPTRDEQIEIAEAIFPDKEFSTVSFGNVWMLTNFIGAPNFNCFAWAILATSTISIPDKLSNFEYLAENAQSKFGAPFDYEPTTTGGADAVIDAWGDDTNNITHATRLITKKQLIEYQEEFELVIEFDTAEALGFPDSSWSSKLGDGVALLIHPRDWLDGSVFGTVQGSMKVQS